VGVKRKQGRLILNHRRTDSQNHLGSQGVRSEWEGGGDWRKKGSKKL